MKISIRFKASMKNLAYISELQVLSSEQKDQQIQFTVRNSPIETE